MKFVFFVAIVVALVFCQFGPATDPATSNCKPSYWCVANNGNCNATFYCGSPTVYCDFGTGACTNKKNNGQNCTSATECLSAYCNLTASPSICAAPAPTTAPPTVATVYEGATCDTTNFCHASLSCVGGTCKKWWSGAAAATCNTVDDCNPGLVCNAGACAAQTGTKQVGATCSADADCTGNAITQACYCDTANQNTAGKCGAAAIINANAFTASGVTACTSYINAYKNTATISSTNAVSALTSKLCIDTCNVLNTGKSTLLKAWEKYNYGGIGTNCVYTAPTACAAITTAGPSTTSSSASAIAASFILSLIALFF